VTFDSISLERKRRIDQVCREFENSRYDEAPPPLSWFLARLPDEDRETGLLELIGIDLELRLSRDETPVVSEYQAQLPDDRELIEQIFEEALRQVSTTASGEVLARPNGMVPDRLGDYRIVREIGRGGMGVVYEAVQESLQRRVAVKVLPRSFLFDSAQAQRFERESQIIARLHHSHIVEVYGRGEQHGVPYYAMKFIDGTGLDQWIAAACADAGPRNAADTFVSATTVLLARGQQASPDERTSPAPADPPVRQARSVEPARVSAERIAMTARTGSQIASALHYAHSQGVLHRDVKPSNILIERNGAVWLTDFGLAKLRQNEDAVSLTQQGDVIGTLRYMAPETLRGKADARSDVYSLGLTLFELIALRPPFAASSRDELLNLRLQADSPQLDEALPGLPRDLVTIIQKAIDHEPDGRYQTAGELADDLRRFLEDEPIHARRPGWFERWQRWARRNKALAGSLLASLALLIAGLIASLLAAGYFHHLNSKLSETVGDLTTRTGELTTARNEASTAAVDNLRLAQDAETARRESQTTLADMQTERGLQAMEKGDAAAAMHWFASAARQTPHDARRQSANRIRAGNAQRQAVMPVAHLPFAVHGVRTRLAFQSDGEWLLAFQPGSLQIWDWSAGIPLKWAGRVQSATDACWLTDGRRLAIGFDGEVQIVEAVSGTVQQRLPFPGRIESLAVSRDGRQLAAGGPVVQVWNIENSPVLEHEWPHPQPVHSLTFNRACNRLATASHDQQVRVFAAGGSKGNGEEAPPAPLFPPLPHQPLLPSPPVFFEGDRQIITADTPFTVRGWDSGTGVELSSGVSVSSTITTLAASPDGLQFACGTETGCQVFDHRDRSRRSFPHRNSVRSVVFHPDGSRIVTASFDWFARCSPLSSDAGSAVEIPNMASLDLCAVSPDGRFVAVCDSRRACVWRLPDDDDPRLTPDLARSRVWDCNLHWPRPSVDGQRVTAGQWHHMASIAPLQEVTVLETRSGYPAGPAIRLPNIIDSCLCSDSRTLAVVSLDASSGLLSWYDSTTGKRATEPVRLPAAPVSVSARSDQPQVAVLCDNGALQVFAVNDGRPLHELNHDSWISRDEREIRQARVLWSPDGTALITVTAQRQVFVRDAETGRLRFPPVQPDAGAGPCAVIDVSSDSRLMAFGTTGTNTVRVWRLDTGEPVSEPLPHPGDDWGIFSVRFSPDGHRLLTASKDGDVRLWDWQAGELLCAPLSHENETYDAAFTPDGRFALVVERGDRVHLWDLHAGKRMASPILFPTGGDSYSRLVGPIAVVSDRAIVTSKELPVINLTQRLTEPAWSTETLLDWAELATGQRIHQGALRSLSVEEWTGIWNHLNDHPHATRDSAQELARQLDETSDSGFRGVIAQRAGRSASLLEELMMLRPGIPQLHAVLARSLDDQPAANRHRQIAIDLHEQHLAAHPYDLAAARQLAELLLESHRPHWHVLETAQLTSDLGATLSRQSDGSVLVTGKDAAGDVYSIIATTSLNRVTAIRLEVIPDPSLPNGGPGRHISGNFQLSKFRAFRQDGTGSLQPIPFADAIASYQHAAPVVDIKATIRESGETVDQVWHVWGRPGERHEAKFVPVEPVLIGPDHSLVVRLSHHREISINLGRFRLSATSAERPLEWERLRESLLQDNRRPVLEILAEAYQLRDLK